MGLDISSWIIIFYLIQIIDDEICASWEIIRDPGQRYQHVQTQSSTEEFGYKAQIKIGKPSPVLPFT